MSSTNIIQAIPLPNITFSSMESGQSGIDNKSIKGYEPNGKYVIKTSSNYNDNTQGFNAFNETTNTYWECDNVNNNNTSMTKNYSKYTQTPYSGITPSSYLGGGSENNTWSTKVGPNKNKIALLHKKKRGAVFAPMLEARSMPPEVFTRF